LLTLFCTNHSGHTRPWDLLNLTELSTRSRKIMFLGSRALPVRRADNLTAIYEGGEVSFTHMSQLTTRNILWYPFLLEAGSA
jgi:hypothetical protein